MIYFIAFELTEVIGLHEPEARMGGYSSVESSLGHRVGDQRVHSC